MYFQIFVHLISEYNRHQNGETYHHRTERFHQIQRRHWRYLDLIAICEQLYLVREWYIYLLMREFVNEQIQTYLPV